MEATQVVYDTQKAKEIAMRLIDCRKRFEIIPSVDAFVVKVDESNAGLLERYVTGAER